MIARIFRMFNNFKPVKKYYPQEQQLLIEILTKYHLIVIKNVKEHQSLLDFNKFITITSQKNQQIFQNPNAKLTGAKGWRER